MLRITFAEDDQRTAQQIDEFLQRYTEGKEAAEIKSYSDGKTLLANYMPCDVLLLDIEMPGLNGMDAARKIRETDQDVAIVFITNMAQYALQGYEVNALDFILKPINYYAFSLRLDRALERVRQRQQARVILELPEGVKVLSTEEIYYLETSNRTLCYHTSVGDYTLRDSLQAAEKKLAPYHFVRCNQCYLVNLNFVTDVRGDEVIVAGQPLKISRRNKASFLAALVDHVGGIR